jgi:hypothetical protein
VHPVYGAKVWQERCGYRHEPFRPDVQARCNAIIFYDPRDAIDRRYIEGEVLPQFARAQVVRVPFAGHPANQFLGDIGFIAPYVRAVVAGTETPVLQRRALRSRSAMYHQVLAFICVQHRHLAWADSLVQRALQIDARRMLAHRTLGLVRLAQQRWSDAQSALEVALQFDPHDAHTIELLERARRGPTPSPPPTPRGVAAWIRHILRAMLRRFGVERAHRAR